MDLDVVQLLVDEIVGIVASSESSETNKRCIENSDVSIVDGIGEFETAKKLDKPSKKKIQGGNIRCITGCHTTSRRHKGIGMFKPTNIKNEYHTEWRRKIDQIILRTRTPDKKYRELVEKKKIYICEKHYKEEDIEFTKTGLKKVKLGHLPSLNLPVKSYEVPEKARKAPASRSCTSDNQHSSSCYKNFDALLISVGKMKLNEWNFVKCEM